MTGIMMNKEFYAVGGPLTELGTLACKIPTLSVKKLRGDAIIPTRAKEGDAGYDLYSVEDVVILPGESKLVSTQVAFEIPPGYVGLIWPRSSMSVKLGIDVLAGVIDSGYRGEVGVCLLNTNPYITDTQAHDNAVQISKGERIAQILIQQLSGLELKEVDELSDSERGETGFGSSGK